MCTNRLDAGGAHRGLGRGVWRADGARGLCAQPGSQAARPEGRRHSRMRVADGGPREVVLVVHGIGECMYNFEEAMRCEPRPFLLLLLLLLFAFIPSFSPTLPFVPLFIPLTLYVSSLAYHHHYIFLHFSLFSSCRAATTEYIECRITMTCCYFLEIMY
ncbi:hypothetical protein B0H16DRAFT_15344 [Mycena metata]|uniref:Uncharacterized protein n=1 Tax=Mycena metata TaxID=1033252 RepID=A0AAD7KI14_9AGAR|nr:hypothetical protein B0H16DRAFT_15344 [Mycena metata]